MRNIALWPLTLAILGFGATLVFCADARATGTETARPRDRWDFKFKDFVIGAWWGPGPTEAEVRLYREAGFNAVMCGRYMELEDYGRPEAALRELELAHKYGLGVMFDTYTKNDRPWGGMPGPYDKHPFHHPANLAELQWLYNKIGKHPALIGFMIGDDQGKVSRRSAACTDFLFKHRPHLMPWLCGWISPENLAEHNNPIANPQIYPTLYNWGLPAEELARRYCATYAAFARQCRQYGVIFWPMFNVAAARGANPAGSYMPSDSLARFPAYAALAYGAEGLWYFTYNGGALEERGPHDTPEEARRALTPLYWVARRSNLDIAAWGPLMLGRTCQGLFTTAFPTPEPPTASSQGSAPRSSPEDCVAPAPGKLIEVMSEDLLVGVLTKPGHQPLAMVVDCRVSKRFGQLRRREATLRFTQQVTAIKVLGRRRTDVCPGREVRLKLRAGEGQMLELEGRSLAALASREAIYAPALSSSSAG